MKTLLVKLENINLAANEDLNYLIHPLKLFFVCEYLRYLFSILLNTGSFFGFSIWY